MDLDGIVDVRRISAAHSRHDRDAAVAGNVLTNDADVDVEPLTVTNPGTYVGAYGTLVLAADGSYTYTPNAAEQGLDEQGIPLKHLDRLVRNYACVVLRIE